MKNQFNTPQKQSPIGVVVMFLDTIRQFARALWPIIVVWIFKFPTFYNYMLTACALMPIIGILLVRLSKGIIFF